MYIANFDSFLEDHFIDPNGVVYTSLHLDTLLPPTDEFFRRYEPEKKEIPSCSALQIPNSQTTWGPDSFSMAEFWAYENCGMCTGAYLNALCCAMRTPGYDTPDIRKRAKRTFDAQLYIFRLGNRWEYGFFPKIWGNRFSYQTSTDQMLYTIHSMHNYYPFATREDRAEIARLIPAMADFWMKRNYTLTYYNIKDMVWPPLRFPSFLMMAWKYSGEEKYRKEALRILEESKGHITEHLIEYRPEYPTEPLALVHSGDAITMDTMNIEMMIDYVPMPEPYRQKLLDGLKKVWHQRKKTLCPDGFYWINMAYDLQTDTAVPKPVECPRSGWSTMIVRAGLEISRLIPEIFPEAKAAAELVLAKLKPEEMYYYHPDDAEQLKPDSRFKMQFLSGDAIANRQWSYYLLKELEAEKTGSGDTAAN